MSKSYFNINLKHIVKKTIIFDMDETLVHCVDDPDIDQADVLLSIKFPEEEEPV